LLRLRKTNIGTAEKLGGNPDIDVSYIYLTYFEEDDEKLKKVYDDYKAGTLLTGELKQMAIALLQEYVAEFQERRAKVTDEVLEQFMKPRKLEWRGNPNQPPPKIGSQAPSEKKLTDRTKK
jgi:tryptophanyl-tRNA synthetase